MSKKQPEMKIDHVGKEIVLSCSFAKLQADPRSPEYKRLCEVVQVFPDYTIIRKSIRKKEGKESYKGLTYAYMEAYIAVKGTVKDKLEFEDMLLLAQCHSIRFPVIKKWFLKKYPEVALYGAKKEFINEPREAA